MLALITVVILSLLVIIFVSRSRNEIIKIGIHFVLSFLKNMFTNVDTSSLLLKFNIFNS